jgi:hypothetical protein
LDDLLGIEFADTVDEGIGPVAAYGRCSAEDNQYPITSRGWQFGNARKFIEPVGGTVAAEFFDVGQSRSVPWERREEQSAVGGVEGPGSWLERCCRRRGHPVLVR